MLIQSSTSRKNVLLKYRNHKDFLRQTKMINYVNSRLDLQGIQKKFFREKKITSETQIYMKKEKH